MLKYVGLQNNSNFSMVTMETHHFLIESYASDMSIIPQDEVDMSWNKMVYDRICRPRWYRSPLSAYGLHSLGHENALCSL